MKNSRKRDRISSLPDELQVDILSFLPVKYAVATSALSKSWRHLYTRLVKHFDLDDSHIFHPLKQQNHAEECVICREFTKKVMFRNRELTDLISLRLHWGTMSLNRDDAKARTWLNDVLVYGIHELDLHMPNYLIYKLPDFVYTSKNLSVMKLEDCKLEVPKLVFLPSLNVLHLNSTEIKHGNDSISRLLAGCPSLKELVLKYIYTERYYHASSMCIISPSLRKLELHFPYYGDVSIKIVVEAPCLQSFKCVDELVNEYSIRESNALVAAHLDVMTSTDMVRQSRSALQHIQAVSTVSRLFLSDDMVEVLTEAFDLKKLPTLHNVAILELPPYHRSPKYCNFTLPMLLTLAPSLEELIFTEAICCGYYVNVTESYDTGKLVVPPSCLGTHLKVIRIEHFWGSEEERQVVKFLLKHAQVLQKLIIHHNRIEDLGKSQLEKSLMRFPRSSKQCVITVLDS